MASEKRSRRSVAPPSGTPPSEPAKQSTQSSAPAPTEFAAGPLDPATVDALLPIYMNAIAMGVMVAADGKPTGDLRAWTKGLLPQATLAAPHLFGDDAPHRMVAIGSLRAAADLGFEARLALEAKRRNEVPREHAPAGFEKAELPPAPTWLERLSREMLTHLAIGCSIEGLADVTLEDVLQGPGQAFAQAANEIDDDGIHRIRSSYLAHPDTGRLYQLVIVRESGRTTVSRRGCGQTELVPVTNGFTLAEVEFLAHAFRTILGEFQPLPFLTGG